MKGSHSVRERYIFHQMVHLQEGKSMNYSGWEGEKSQSRNIFYFLSNSFTFFFVCFFGWGGGGVRDGGEVVMLLQDFCLLLAFPYCLC